MPTLTIDFMDEDDNEIIRCESKRKSSKNNVNYSSSYSNSNKSRKTIYNVPIYNSFEIIYEIRLSGKSYVLPSQQVEILTAYVKKSIRKLASLSPELLHLHIKSSTLLFLYKFSSKILVS